MAESTTFRRICEAYAIAIDFNFFISGHWSSGSGPQSGRFFAMKENVIYTLRLYWGAVNKKQKCPSQY